MSHVATTHEDIFSAQGLDALEHVDQKPKMAVVEYTLRKSDNTIAWAHYPSMPGDCVSRYISRNSGGRI